MNNEWVEITMRGKLEFAQDLHAPDAVYHQACSVNFRMGKQSLKKHGNDTDSKRAKGRPTDSSTRDLFFISQLKRRSMRREIWEIKKIKAALGPETCANILFCSCSSRM